MEQADIKISMKAMTAMKVVCDMLMDKPYNRKTEEAAKMFISSIYPADSDGITGIDIRFSLEAHPKVSAVYFYSKYKEQYTVVKAIKEGGIL